MSFPNRWFQLATFPRLVAFLLILQVIFVVQIIFIWQISDELIQQKARLAQQVKERQSAEEEIVTPGMIRGL